MPRKPLFRDDSPLFDGEGNLREITRIEFLLIDDGISQCNWWAGDILVHSEACRPGNRQRIIRTTEMFLEPYDAYDGKNPFTL